MGFKRAFSHMACWAAIQSGHASTFVAAVMVIVVWGVTGPLFHWSDTWQLIINTGTTIVTFLMVFLIQNSQNRDTEQIQLKLDELIRANAKARNALLNLEDLTEEQLRKVKASFRRLADSDMGAAEEVGDAPQARDRAARGVSRLTDRRRGGGAKKG